MTITTDSICAVLPAYNEAANLPDVIGELTHQLATHFTEWRVLIVDDGSTDGTAELLAELESEHPQLSHIHVRTNRGKSNALRVAFENIHDDLIVLLDADGQDDPSELGALLESLYAGHDLVIGRRADRQDRFVKRLTSQAYNRATAMISGVSGTDFNSGFKLMRRAVADELNLYGELHRYIPVLAAWAGFHVTEVDVNHRNRLHGTSKFGRSRFWRGMLDLLTVKFLTTYDRRPFHLIGGSGLAVGAVGFSLMVWMLIERLSGNAVGSRPALLAGVTLFLVGVQLISVGLLAELLVHLHHQQRNPPD